MRDRNRTEVRNRSVKLRPVPRYRTAVLTLAMLIHDCGAPARTGKLPASPSGNFTLPQVSTNGITLEYESFGSAADPVVLLIMGLGTQLTRWPVPLCEKLVARGFRVIRFDNRDIGLSTRLDDEPVPLLATIIAARMA